MNCAICGKQAACVGVYDPYPDIPETQVPAPACDDCCGHCCEDGWCVPIDEWKRKPMLQDAAAILDSEED